MNRPKPRYGRPHRRERESWVPRVATGTVRCARGAGCLYRDRPSGTLILPGELWDLGHDDLNPSGPSLPEHRKCNRATAGRGAAEIAAARAGRASAAEAVERPFLDDGNSITRWSQHWYGGFNTRCPACRALGRACPDAAADTAIQTNT